MNGVGRQLPHRGDPQQPQLRGAPHIAQGQAGVTLHRPPTESVDTPAPSLAEWSQGTPARDVAQQKGGLHQAFEQSSRPAACAARTLASTPP